MHFWYGCNSDWTPAEAPHLTAVGGVGYLLAKELWGTYPLVDEAVALIRDDPALQGSLGRQLSVFGPGDGRRRRPLVHTSLGPDGRQLVEASFYVQGEQGTRGRVSLRAMEREPGQWEKQLLAVDIPGHPTHYLIRSTPLRVRSAPSGWNPFSRWFSQ